jgi:hypothetical protein
VLAGSTLRGHYDEPVDRESAYEKLKARAASSTDDAGGARTPRGEPKTADRPAPGGGLTDLIFGSTGPRGGRREGMVEAAAKSAARSIGSSLARSILGTLLGGRRR